VTGAPRDSSTVAGADGSPASAAADSRPGSAAAHPFSSRAAAEAAWAARVRAHHEQTARLRETPEGGDFYAPVSRLFIADPRRTDDEALEHLLALARPQDVWLDIGAGAGRYALPLALRVREVIAVDPSAAMLDALRDQATEHGIANIGLVEARWPIDPGAGPALSADVALIANLGYDIEEIGPFLDAMEAAAGRLCVALLADRQPSSPAHVFWPPVHGEVRAELPALDDFVAILGARGRQTRLARFPRPPRGFPSRDELVRWLRNQLFVAEGSAKDRVLARELESWLATHPDGTLGLSSQAPTATGIVIWEPA
jgi:SAM-dependent methyltransferase